MDGTYFANKVAELLAQRFEIEKAEERELPNRFLEFQRDNMAHAAANEKLQLRKEEFDIEVYKIIRNKASEEYFLEESHYAGYKNGLGEQLLLVCLEKKTGYLYTNCSKLSLEVILEVGILDEDIQNKTLWYHEYQSAIEHYKRFYGKETFRNK